MSRLLIYIHLALLLGFASPVPLQTYGSSSNLSNADSSLTILYQNNLNGSDDVNHISAILLDSYEQSQAAAACESLSEHLLTQQAIAAHYDDLYYQLSYLQYEHAVEYDQQYIIDNGVVAFNSGNSCLDFLPRKYHNSRLPILCTQSSNASQPANSSASLANEVTIAAGPNDYLGFRNLKSWRFSGIPYADPPQRFKYTTLYSGTGQTLNATSYGSECVQSGLGGAANGDGEGSEDCLFLNIQTPRLPRAGSKQLLKPVYFFIHGGGFNNGVGSDPGFDGGNLASREDVVVVTINYRVGTLGFLAIPGTNITGNYGIADQILALHWVKNYISNFGGDPDQITILGSSAGAGSVRVLLGSPPAIGLFEGGVAESNLGGGVDLGLASNYGTSYSSYLTIAEAYAVAGPQIFAEVGCNQTTLDAQIACLTTASTYAIGNAATIADKVVQDGYYVNTEELIVSVKNGSTAHVPVIFGKSRGTAENDGASFSTYDHANNITSELEGIEFTLGINESYAQAIIDSGLFPYYDTGNITLDSFNVSQRVATDTTFRCVDEATVYAGSVSGAFKKAYYYQSDRTQLGYDPNGLGGPPVTPGYPFGNPNLPYFRTHGSDQGFSFGNLPYFRDAADYYALQLETSYYASFVKWGDPNAPLAYLEARGYGIVIEGAQKSGPWDPVKGLQGPVKLLDWPSISSGFVDVPQCAFLNYSLTYYLDGGS